ncbi:ribonuclease R [Pararhizobium mangrovi]|uniref:ribonuclease R n=1 Tax=Pararhizobium mangrovi TaxID=2590452 RepID=UPI001F3CA9C1|nr:ribonuclease R [Pararhizobium mangrovi]
MTQRTGGRPRKTSSTRKRPEGGVLDRETLLRFVSDHPDRANKRDIAKAFSVKGDDRIALKHALRELEEEGLLQRDRKQLKRPGDLPPVALLDITHRDNGGGLLARPASWNEDDGTAPAVSIRPPSDKGRGKRPAPAPGVGDRVLARLTRVDDPIGAPYSAKVMKIIDRNRGTGLGVFRETTSGEARIMPIDRRQQELAVGPDDTGGAKDGDLVEVEATGAGRYGLKRGKVVKIVGSIGGEKALSTIALYAHGIPDRFSEATIAEAEAAEPATMKAREDWRDLPLVTIDPATAKDHDDAVHAEADPDPANEGGVIVTVAIADVAYYVRTGSALDREALRRGNSVYFPDRVVPMLPERISNDLCSLREGVERPALAVRMTFAGDGRKLKHRFHRVMMKSVAGLAYEQAQAAIDGRVDAVTGHLMDTVLTPLWHAYEVLGRGRSKRQPLELDLPERRLELAEDGTIARVVVPERLDAHRLIEEFMIQANVSAAETLENRRQPLVYRVHDEPSLAKQESLRDFLSTLDIPFARGNLRANHFNGILERAEDEPYEQMVSEMVLRSQSQAVYAPENIGHFGLNLMRYAHFTSPIRRYADLIVHRALIGALGLGEGAITPEEESNLTDIAADISTFERRAMAAERETVDRLVAHHLAGRIGTTFEGRIAGVTKSGLFVALPQYGADGFIPVSTIGEEYYVYDEAHQALTGDRSGLGYRLGDTVEVRLKEAIPLAGSLLFEMLSEPTKMPATTRSYHKASRQADRQRVSRERRKGQKRAPRGRH